jgi:hypothetical protein
VPVRATRTPVAPAWRATTQSSQITVANIGKASNCRRTSIHSPGRGSNAPSLGKNPITRNGSAMPMPRKRKMPRPKIAGPASADAIAAPMKGAVHGVATATATRPVPKLPTTPLRAASVEPMPAKRELNSKPRQGSARSRRRATP